MVNSDCVAATCFTGKCNGDGSSAAVAGQTCKQIKRMFPSSINGVYWIKGLNYYFPTAIQVNCWMDTARAGGGWYVLLLLR